jgi:ribosome-associated protein
MEFEAIEIRTPTIRVDALLKFAGLAGTGGEAKQLIQTGRVRVNGEIETRRSHALSPGDRLELLDEDDAVIRGLIVERQST